MTSTSVTVVRIDRLVDAVLAVPPVLEGPFVTVIHVYFKGLLAGSTSSPVVTTAQLG